MNLPNLISLARLLSVPLIFWLILDGRMTLAFWLIVAAGISDAVDGFIAKRFALTSTFGAWLDPLADKALLVAVYVALGNGGYLPLWIVVLVVSRDVMIIGGVLLTFLLRVTIEAAPSMLSKVNTVAQIVLVGVVMGEQGLRVDVAIAAEILVWVVAATTILSGGGYLVLWLRRLGGVGGPA